jgi:carbon storage regulator
MLILSRKLNESIVIDGRIVVKVMRVDGEAVKIGIDAPKDVPVHRQEIYAEIHKSNQEALATDRAALPKLAAVFRAELVNIVPLPPTPPSPAGSVVRGATLVGGRGSEMSVPNSTETTTK